MHLFSNNQLSKAPTLTKVDEKRRTKKQNPNQFKEPKPTISYEKKTHAQLLILIIISDLNCPLHFGLKTISEKMLQSRIDQSTLSLFFLGFTFVVLMSLPFFSHHLQRDP